MSKSQSEARARIEAAERLRQEKERTKAPAGPLSEEQLVAARKKQAEEIEKTLTSKYQNYNTNRMLSELHNLAVVEGSKEYVGRLPESIFVQYFLPYFREKIEEKDLTPEKLAYRNKVLEDWISVAGTTANEVNIINNVGQTLFTVPALTNTKVISPIRKDGAVSFETIANMAERLRVMSPAQSVDYQHSRLHDKLKDMSTGTHKFKEYEKIWLDIFNRYSDVKDPAQSGSQKSTDTTDNKNNNQSDPDELVYD